MGHVSLKSSDWNSHWSPRVCCGKTKHFCSNDVTFLISLRCLINFNIFPLHTLCFVCVTHCVSSGFVVHMGATVWIEFLLLVFLLQDDKDLVHEFVMAEGLTCLIKVGAEADQNYQNYILRGTTLPHVTLYNECTWFDYNISYKALFRLHYIIHPATRYRVINSNTYLLKLLKRDSKHV